MRSSGIKDYDLGCTAIIDGFRDGNVIPFLGSGVNLCDRPHGVKWQQDVLQCFPSGTELAEHLAMRCRYSSSDRGKFVHHAANGDRILITKPNEYRSHPRPGFPGAST